MSTISGQITTAPTRIHWLSFRAMTSRPRANREAPPGDARERIVTTAYSLFCRHGIRAVGVDTIIDQSGVAKMTMYRHFRSKDDLVLEVSPPSRLWSEMTRTALGVRIDRGAPAPLADGDVVLRIEDVPLAGMSVEQAEQLSLLADVRPGASTRVGVLRKGLPQAHAYDLVYRHCLDVDRSGKRVAFGSTTGGLWMSEDQGDSWRRVSTQLPPIHCVRFG